MSCRNISFLNRLVELCGKYVSPYTGKECPLISISDLQHFEMDRERSQVLVLNDRCKPVIGWLQDYGKYDFGPCDNDAEAELPNPSCGTVRRIVALGDICHIAEKTTAEKLSDAVGQDKEDEASTAIRSSIDSLVAALEARTEELEIGNEAQTAIGARHDSPEPVEGDFMSYYYKGDYEKAIECCVSELEYTTPEPVRALLLNNIAFLLRIGNVDPGKIDAPFSLEPKELLAPGVAAERGFPLMNQALYDIQLSEFQQAMLNLRIIPEAEWRDIARFWLYDVWQRKGRNPEGALVPVLGLLVPSENTRHNVTTMIAESGIASIATLREEARRAYPTFLAYLEDNGAFGEVVDACGDGVIDAEELLADFNDSADEEIVRQGDLDNQSDEDERAILLAEIEKKIAAIVEGDFDE